MLSWTLHTSSQCPGTRIHTEIQAKGNVPTQARTSRQQDAAQVDDKVAAREHPCARAYAADTKNARMPMDSESARMRVDGIRTYQATPYTRRQNNHERPPTRLI